MKWAIFLYLFFGGQSPEATKVLQLENTFPTQTACEHAIEDKIREFMMSPESRTMAGERINYYNIEQSVCRPVNN